MCTATRKPQQAARLLAVQRRHLRGAVALQVILQQINDGADEALISEDGPHLIRQLGKHAVEHVSYYFVQRPRPAASDPYLVMPIEPLHDDVLPVHAFQGVAPLQLQRDQLGEYLPECRPVVPRIACMASR